MDSNVELFANVCGLQEPEAVAYLNAVGGIFEDACYLYYSLTGKPPELFSTLFDRELLMSPNFTLTIKERKAIGPVSPQEVTQWQDVAWQQILATTQSERQQGNLKADEEEKCVICMCEFSLEDEGEIVKLGKCKSHFFHKTCISRAFGTAASVKCPICGVSYGEQIGDMPAGVMHVELTQELQCDGYETATWVITYIFHSGKQNGVAYKGTKRQAFLPNTAEGREVMRLLICSFYRRQTFTVGTSVTTGESNCVVWSGIHHKTSPDGGPTNFGYPDGSYFSRVKEELAAHGVIYSAS